MQTLDAEIGAHPLVFVGEQARVRELALGFGKRRGEGFVFGFQPVKFREVCAVAGYAHDQLRMIFRMFFCVNHFFLIYYVELNVFSTVG